VSIQVHSGGVDGFGVSNVQTATLASATDSPAGTLFSRIVLGIDFGPASLAAARWATAHVAVQAHALLSHVLPFPERSRNDVDAAATDAHDESLRQMTGALRGGLGGFAATLDVASARNVLRIGSPSQWLSVLADDAQASLLVLGRRADANRNRVGEPNVIERSARRTNASVLVVPEGTTQPPAHIVAAVDESIFAPRVLDVAALLARLHEVPMTVLHVLSPVVGVYERLIRKARHAMVAGRQSPASNERADAPSSLSIQTARWLAELGETCNAVGRDRVEVAIGDPARVIATTGAASAASLVVMGMRGADETPPGSVGSVARELLARAPVPVLAVNAAM
jgi:nucleotide-binding universal stress UspA family protein